MNELATPQQLRTSYVRWALVAFPVLMLLSLVSAQLGGGGADNPWYQQLVKPPYTPAGWVFGVVWTLIYLTQALALAMILNARRAVGRGLALGLYAVLLVGQLAWTPLFFGARQVSAATVLLIVLVMLAIGVLVAFRRVRVRAGWLMIPTVLWLAFASVLSIGIDRANPNAEGLAGHRASTHIGPAPKR